jgi:hypothetical protein
MNIYYIHTTGKQIMYSMYFFNHMFSYLSNKCNTTLIYGAKHFSKISQKYVIKKFYYPEDLLLSSEKISYIAIYDFEYYGHKECYRNTGKIWSQIMEKYFKRYYSVNFEITNKKKIPKRIKYLTFITKLKVEDVKFLDVQLISHLKNLKSLHITNTNFSSKKFSDCCTKWVNLTELVFNNNSIDTFPKGILQLTKLLHLDFSYNNIKLIPNQISKLSQLTIFEYYENPILKLPHSMIKLKKLKKLKKIKSHNYTISDKKIMYLNKKKQKNKIFKNYDYCDCSLFKNYNYCQCYI